MVFQPETALVLDLNGPEFYSLFCFIPTFVTIENYLIFLSFSFLNCKMGEMLSNS